MKLFLFLLRANRSKVALAVLISVISGATNAGLIALIHRAWEWTGAMSSVWIWRFVGVLAVLIATIVAILAGVFAWRFDQRSLRCGSPGRGALAAVILAGGVWVCALIQAMFLLQVPGAYGPVQYWGDDATRMHGPRMLALLVVYLGYFLAPINVAVALWSLRGSEPNSENRVFMPLLGGMSILLAGHWYEIYGILPTA